MTIELITKASVTHYIKINGVSFEIHKLLTCLNEIDATEEDSSCGEGCLRSYQITHISEMRKLVELGFVRNYTGPRMSNCFHMASEKEIGELKKLIYEKEEEIDKQENEISVFIIKEEADVNGERTFGVHGPFLTKEIAKDELEKLYNEDDYVMNGSHPLLDKESGMAYSDTTYSDKYWVEFSIEEKFVTIK